jgi:cystine transport system substrate-binding protein
MSGLRCAHCGTQAPADAQRCSACGANALTADADAPARPAPRGRAARFAAGTTALVALGAVIAGAEWAVRGGPAPPDDGTLRVAVDPDAPPFLQRTDSGWEGYEYALIQAIGESLHRPVTLVPTPYEDVTDAVAAGTVSLGVAQLPPTPHAGVGWSRSYLQYTLCLVVRVDEPPTALAAFRGRRVGRYPDATAEAVVRAALGNADVQIYDDRGYFEDLERGTLDAMVYDCPLARHELRSHPMLKIADDHLDVATYSIAVSDARPGLLADVDRVLADLGTQGLFPALTQRWLGGDAPASFSGATTRVIAVAPGETWPDLVGRALGDPGRSGELQAWNQDILGSGAPVVYPGLLIRVR